MLDIVGFGYTLYDLRLSVKRADVSACCLVL